jgi:hypothetical protein
MRVNQPSVDSGCKGAQIVRDIGARAGLIAADGRRNSDLTYLLLRLILVGLYFRVEIDETVTDNRFFARRLHSAKPFLRGLPAASEGGRQGTFGAGTPGSLLSFMA